MLPLFVLTDELYHYAFAVLKEMHKTFHYISHKTGNQTIFLIQANIYFLQKFLLRSSLLSLFCYHYLKKRSHQQNVLKVLYVIYLNVKIVSLCEQKVFLSIHIRPLVFRKLNCLQNVNYSKY
jgi:hypothetical protein